jgi:TM2 domain-containing membrane protein YozV
MSITTQEQMLVEQRVANDGKSIVVAYVLLVLLGGFGAHRFYLGRLRTAIAMLALNLLGWLLIAPGVGVMLLLPLVLWMIVDLFLVPGMVAASRQNLRARITQEIAETSDAVAG